MTDQDQVQLALSRSYNDQFKRLRSYSSSNSEASQIHDIFEDVTVLSNEDARPIPANTTKRSTRKCTTDIHSETGMLAINKYCSLFNDKTFFNFSKNFFQLFW
jgi:hypothetical protein